VSRGWFKRVAEHGLLLSGLPRLARQWRSRHTIILAYHNIVPNGEQPVGDRALQLPQAAFAAQLDALRETHDVISLTEAIEGDALPRRRPRAVITFDDAYGGAVKYGVAELCARAMPATIFVTPAFLDGGAFWWDLLTPWGAAAPPARVRQYALTAHAGRSDRILADRTLSPGVQPVLPPFSRGAPESELLAAAGKPGITLASHSWSHPNRSALEPEELEQELFQPLAWLRGHVDSPLPYLSYPYGLSGPRVESAAEKAGYRAALCIDGGWLHARPERIFALPRQDVPSGISLEGFRLRIAGVLS
jgi:peptidoglycan/xylan/chitin deacetylase (PgdA/CDA1 family)